MIEAYKLVLTHYAVNEGTGERIRLEEPICVEQIYDRRYGGSPIILNRMCDEMKHYILDKVDEKRTIMMNDDKSILADIKSGKGLPPINS